MPALREHWKGVVELLADARATLPPLGAEEGTTAAPDAGATHGSLQEFDELLAHNELELAWDTLAEVASRADAGSATWVLLAKAASRMRLEAHVKRAMDQLEKSLDREEPRFRIVYMRRYRTPRGRIVWRRPVSVERAKNLRPA